MITKAQLDAALSDLEKKIEKNMSIKIDAKIVAIKEGVRSQIEELEKNRESEEDEIFAEVEESLERVRSDCRANVEEIQILKEKLHELEQFIAATAKEEEGDFLKDEIEEEITDDFGL